MVDDEMFQTREIPLTNLDCIKSKNYSDICNKNNRNINDKEGDKKLELDNLKDLINNCNIKRVDDKVTWAKKISPSNLNYIKNKSHDDIYNKSNCNISNKISNKELKSNKLEDLEWLPNINCI